MAEIGGNWRSDFRGRLAAHGGLWRSVLIRKIRAGQPYVLMIFPDADGKMEQITREHYSYLNKS